MGRRRIAGDDERLHALLDEKRSDLAAIAPDGVRALGPVGDTCSIAEVRHALVRQLLHHGVGDGETADAGIEDADWSGGVHHVNFAPTLAPSGVTRTDNCAGSSQRLAATKASAPEKR